jgi:hypothetical protein
MSTSAKEKEPGSSDAKACPWCERWCLKDAACHYVFSCGLDFNNVFHVGKGCGRTWCWVCCKKYCSQYHDPVTGQRLPTAKDHHDASCCTREPGYKKEDYCPGGHNPHCGTR